MKYMKLYKIFLKTISVNDIHLQSTFKKQIFLDKSAKSYYMTYKDYDTEDLKDFINDLDSNGLYSVIPMISMKSCLNKPYIVLSPSILVSKYSNYHFLTYFIHKKHMETIDEFDMKNIEKPVLILKYKRIFMDITQLNRKYDPI
uniref:Uncharacterized protein n=1 Tax=Russula compacta TaxID=40490 RepID=A0A2S0U3K2_9AGAM|nr:hypothetical protein [Russula compacta]AWB36068.1 hypothetical protein [Russula compacta]